MMECAWGCGAPARWRVAQKAGDGSVRHVCGRHLHVACATSTWFGEIIHVTPYATPKDRKR